MKHIRLKAADPLLSSDPLTEPVTIEISGNVADDTKKILNSDHLMEKVKKYYDDEAQKLFDALVNSLPQGIMEPLTIKLLQRRVSLYHGVMK